ncbi:MAG TPA: hypothetical protein EYG27_09310 [Dehalococcoidia bacterium]|jgi:hypothetical protein|nr:hypothetical protein [Dehalococcoidia bacterium]
MIEWVGRLAGVVIIIGGLALGSKAWNASDSDGIWMFLNNALSPVGLGVLIIVASDIASKLGNKNN